MIGFKIIDPVRKIPIGGGASTTTADGGAAASGWGGATHLLATERRSLDKRTSRLSSGSSQPGSLRLGGGAGNNGGASSFDDSWNDFSKRRPHSGSGFGQPQHVGQSNAENNGKYHTLSKLKNHFFHHELLLHDF